MNLTTLNVIDFFLTPAEKWFMHQLEDDQENAIHSLSIWINYIEDIYRSLQNCLNDRTYFLTREYTSEKTLPEFIEFIDGNGFYVDFSAEPGVMYEVKLKSNT